MSILNTSYLRVFDVYPASARYSILTRDNDYLREQYEALLLKFRRADDRYKQDYKKWREFNAWLKGEDKRHRELRNQEDMTPEEKRELELKDISNKLQYFYKNGPRLDGVAGEEEESVPPPTGGIALPEHLATPDVQPSDIAFLASSRTLVGKSQVRAMPIPVQNEVVGSSDTEEESVLEVTPMPQRSGPVASCSRTVVATRQNPKQRFDPPSASPTVFTTRRRDLQEIDVAPSSDTEEASECMPFIGCLSPLY